MSDGISICIIHISWLFLPSFHLIIFSWCFWMNFWIWFSKSFIYSLAIVILFNSTDFCFVLVLKMVIFQTQHICLVLTIWSSWIRFILNLLWGYLLHSYFNSCSICTIGFAYFILLQLLAASASNLCLGGGALACAFQMNFKEFLMWSCGLNPFLFLLSNLTSSSLVPLSISKSLKISTLVIFIIRTSLASIIIG